MEVADTPPASILPPVTVDMGPASISRPEWELLLRHGPEHPHDPALAVVVTDRIVGVLVEPGDGLHPPQHVQSRRVASSPIVGAVATGIQPPQDLLPGEHDVFRKEQTEEFRIATLVQTSCPSRSPDPGTARDCPARIRRRRMPRTTCRPRQERVVLLGLVGPQETCGSSAGRPARLPQHSPRKVCSKRRICRWCRSDGPQIPQASADFRSKRTSRCFCRSRQG